MAAKYDITCDQGATFSRVITWLDSTGVPVNLTSYTARMQVRATVDAASTIFSLTSPSNITLGGSAGTITIVISAATTAAATAGDYVYDLELVSSSGIVTRLIQGCFVLDAEVTR